MTQIRPFCGLRPVPEYAAEIAALPYDVMDTEEARQILNKNPLSFLRVTKSEATMSDCIDPHSQAVYKMAKTNLDRYLSDGQMKKDTTPCYYIYRQQMGQHIQIGLVAAASVEEYRENIIKKHELTRHDKEQDRVNHILATEAQTGAVFLTYKGKPEINTYVLSLMGAKKPVYDFTSEDGVQHTLYVVENLMEIAELTRLFEDEPVMYIADGHHRSAAAMRVADELGKTPRHGSNEEYNTFLAVIFPDNMMQIMDYNRLVKDLNGLSMEEFLSRVGEKFEISELENGPKPEARHQFSMYLTGKWRRLTAKEGTFAADDVIGSLDVSILQDNLLAPILGIKDPRTDERINFMGGIRGLDALAAKVDAGAYSVAFAMYPTSMEELIKVADAGKIMPPKSTWFEPKLRDAMVVHLIGEDE